jgi:hypothetical protein
MEYELNAVAAANIAKIDFIGFSFEDRRYAPSLKIIQLP